MSSTLIRPAGAQQPAATPPAASGRFAGLDGIRALAIISVFVFHLYPAWLPGGFLGVDVFFVISGFLITSLLIRERATKGRIDFKAFWTRRARRLLPAGVAALSGAFEKGDCVRLIDADGRAVGVGLAAYAADEAARIRGRRSDEIEAVLGYRGASVLIHRDDMVLDDR